MRSSNRRRLSQTHKQSQTLLHTLLPSFLSPFFRELENSLAPSGVDPTLDYPLSAPPPPPSSIICLIFSRLCSSFALYCDSLSLSLFDREGHYPRSPLRSGLIALSLYWSVYKYASPDGFVSKRGSHATSVMTSRGHPPLSVYSFVDHRSFKLIFMIFFTLIITWSFFLFLVHLFLLHIFT